MVLWCCEVCCGIVFFSGYGCIGVNDLMGVEGGEVVCWFSNLCLFWNKVVREEGFVKGC